VAQGGGAVVALADDPGRPPGEALAVGWAEILAGEHDDRRVLRCRIRVEPSMSGMSRSQMMRPNAWFLAIRRPSAPLAAVTTWYPSCLSVVSTTRSVPKSSSMTRIFSAAVSAGEAVTYRDTHWISRSRSIGLTK
jgi:hypothetical protein